MMYRMKNSLETRLKELEKTKIVKERNLWLRDGLSGCPPRAAVTADADEKAMWGCHPFCPWCCTCRRLLCNPATAAAAAAATAAAAAAAAAAALCCCCCCCPLLPLQMPLLPLPGCCPYFFCSCSCSCPCCPTCSCPALALPLSLPLLLSPFQCSLDAEVNTPTEVWSDETSYLFICYMYDSSSVQ